MLLRKLANVALSAVLACGLLPALAWADDSPINPETETPAAIEIVAPAADPAAATETEPSPEESALEPLAADPRLSVLTLNGVTARFEDGTYPWAVTDGYPLCSTNAHTNNSTSETTVVLSAGSPYTVSFNYTVSSESGYDKFTVYVDGTADANVNGISGEQKGRFTKSFSSGTHRITLSYKKDGSEESGSDMVSVIRFTAEASGSASCYAVLYEDGSLVFQYIPNGIGGTALWSWLFNPDSQTLPWEDYRSSITSVRFDTPVAPTSTIYWFGDCTNLRYADLSGLDGSRLTNMAMMFNGCTNLMDVTFEDLQPLDTSHVTIMNGMFNGCTNLTNLNFSCLNTSSVTGMLGTFANSGLRKLDLRANDLSSLSSMELTFQNCSALETLWLPESLGSSSTVGLAGTFRNCDTLKTIYAPRTLGGVDPEYEASEGAFEGCTSLVGGAGTVFDATHANYTYARVDGDGGPGYFTRVTSAQPCYAVLYEGGALAFQNGPEANPARGNKLQAWLVNPSRTYLNSIVGSVAEIVQEVYFDTPVAPTNMDSWFANCINLRAVDFGSLNTSNLESCAGMFYRCENLGSADLSALDFSRVWNMGSMFLACSSLQSAIMPTMAGNASLNLTQLFSNCGALTSVDFSRAQGAQIQYGWGAFAACTALESLDLTGLRTDAAEELLFMFGGCTNLKQLDISTFNLSGVQGLNGTFQNCSALQTIKVAEDFAPVTSEYTENMFDGCTSLVGGAGTVFDAAHANGAYARIDGGADAPGYFTAARSTQWQEPIFNIADDGSYAFAIWTCADDLSKLEIARCQVTLEGVTPATCDAPGTATYVAAVAANPAKGLPAGSATKTVETEPALGHQWGAAVVEFAADHSAATATWTCGRDGSHVVTAACQVAKEGTSATCFAAGNARYTATALAADGALTALAVEDAAEPALGHAFHQELCERCATQLGDVNGNGVVNIVDAQIAYDLAVNRMYASEEALPALRTAADMDADTVIDAIDAWRIQNLAIRG